MTSPRTPESDAVPPAAISCIEPDCERPVVHSAVRCRVHLTEALQSEGETIPFEDPAAVVEVQMRIRHRGHVTDIEAVSGEGLGEGPVDRPVPLVDLGSPEPTPVSKAALPPRGPRRKLRRGRPVLSWERPTCRARAVV